MNEYAYTVELPENPLKEGDSVSVELQQQLQHVCSAIVPKWKGLATENIEMKFKLITGGITNS